MRTQSGRSRDHTDDPAITTTENSTAKSAAARTCVHTEATFERTCLRHRFLGPMEALPSKIR
jgi:hypothetical protein